MAKTASQRLADGCATSENEFGEFESDHVARSSAMGRWMGVGWEDKFGGTVEGGCFKNQVESKINKQSRKWIESLSGGMV
jgi:hypothetical protein